MELHALGFCYVQISQSSLWHLARTNQDAHRAPHPNPGRKKAVSTDSRGTTLEGTVAAVSPRLGRVSGPKVQRHQVAHPNVHSTLKRESGFL